MAVLCPLRREAPLPKFAKRENSEEVALASCQRFMAGPRDALLRNELFETALHYAGAMGLGPDAPDAAAAAMKQVLQAAMSDKKREIRATAYSVTPRYFKADARNLAARGLADPEIMVRIGAAVAVEAMGDAAAAREQLQSDWSSLEADDLRRAEVLTAGARMDGSRPGLQRLCADAFRSTIAYPILSAAASLLRSVPRESLDPDALEAIRRATASDDPHAATLANEVLRHVESR